MIWRTCCNRNRFKVKARQSYSCLVRMLHVECLPVMNLLQMSMLPFVWLHFLALQEGLRIHCGSFLILRVESGNCFTEENQEPPYSTIFSILAHPCSICSHFDALWPLTAFWFEVPVSCPCSVHVWLGSDRQTAPAARRRKKCRKDLLGRPPWKQISTLLTSLGTFQLNVT